MLAGAMGPAWAQLPPPAAPRALPLGLADPTETLELWPESVLGEGRSLIERVQERSTDASYADRAVSSIARPRLVVFRPERPNGAAVVIMPGGAYRWVVVDKEGYECARWLAARGVTACVLFYRLPGDGWRDRSTVALADAQRAVRQVRAHAARLNVDPDRIATMGFSAGGHLCAELATGFATRVYPRVDGADDLSARPRLASLLYPVIDMALPLAHAVSRAELLGAAPSAAEIEAHSPHRRVPADAPPQFLLHAADDTAVPVEHSLLLHAALRAARVPSELHVYPNGGHGFGLRLARGTSVERWPELWWAWAARHGLIAP